MMLEDFFNNLPKKGETEFHIFLCTLKTLGIPHSMHWMPSYKNNGIHATLLKEGGFNLSEDSINGVVIGDKMFVFSSGQAHWTGEEGHGPSSAFLYILDTKTNTATYRAQYKSDGFFYLSGLQALKNQYGF